VSRVSDPDGAIDVFVLLGWPQQPDFVHRQIAFSRQLTCAAPRYWAARGVPRRPRDLERHNCLPFRNPEGTVIDLWQYEREGKVESVTVRGWLTSNHRDVLLDAVLASEGVARLTDLTIGPHLASGHLVPVLLEWEMKDAPPINLLYRPNHRRDPRVRAFADFVTAVFGELEAKRETAIVSRSSSELPYWHRRRRGRASAAPRLK
jgi:DNA-binding transcriptional LysR family regulator